MRRGLARRQPGGLSQPFSIVSAAERRQADLFWADLIGVPARTWETEFAEGDDLRSWPTLTKLPDSIVDQIVANRSRITRRDSELRAVENGYSASGRTFPRSAMFTPEEEQNPRLQALLKRLDYELGGEGGTSAILTGDRAKFTWGRGYAHKVALAAWVKEFFATTPQAKEALLDLGITMSDGVWKIVDTDSRTVKSGEAAIDFLNKRDPPETKKLLLSIFMNVAEQFGTAAADAQWKATKQLYFDTAPKDIVNDPKWSPEAFCYVVHCLMWGRPAGWDRFRATGGDMKKILRLEVDYTRYFEEREGFLFVPPKMGGVFPSITMLLNMGRGYMVRDCVTEDCINSRVLEPLGSLAGAQKGDVVFQLPKKTAKSEYYVLRGVPRMYDKLEELMDKIEKIQATQMSGLLKYFDQVRDKNGKNKGYAELKQMRDHYASSKNPRKESMGLRPRVAMDAVLHRGEGEPSGWILSDARRANLPPDQIELIKKKVGLN
jgi:hypothetical protein